MRVLQAVKVPVPVMLAQRLADLARHHSQGTSTPESKEELSSTLDTVRLETFRATRKVKVGAS